MKKIFSILAAAVVLAVSCEPSTPAGKTYEVNVALEVAGEAYAVADATVTMRNLNGNTSYTSQTNENGVAAFSVPAGLYEASCSFKHDEQGILYTYNGVTPNVSVTESGDKNFKISLVASKTSQIIVKEMYTGGCKGSTGSAFRNDSYIILYNNSSTVADASKVCFAFAMPFNSNASSPWRTDDGKLSYEDSYIPAGYGIWYFNTDVKIQPYSQIVVATKGAINHAETHPNSIDLRNADYVMYDPESGYNNSYYAAPSATIPTTNYLKAYKWGAGNGWALSVGSAAFFIYNMENPAAFIQNEANTENPAVTVGVCAKIPLENVVDAVEIFAIGKESQNAKRIPATLDAGYVYHTTDEGYTVYRNVDKEATEAIEGNKAKLVYDYSLGTTDIDQTTDPSGIDAEASIANGATIIYKDTNNSTNDFHLRKKSSLKK